VREEFKGESWRDFQQRYQGTYGWYEKPSGGKLLVSLIEVDEHACKFMNADGGVFTALSDKGNAFQFIPVMRGIYRTQQGLVYCRRVPAKQYKRGIAQGNTHVERLPGQAPLKISFDLVADMFGGDFPNEVDQFKSGQSADVVFNNAFAFSGPYIWLYNNIIGIRSNKKLQLHSTLFKQEIEDVLASNGLVGYEIEVRA
jgi:hypothetical protein